MEYGEDTLHSNLNRWRDLQEVRPLGKGFVRLAELLHRGGRHDEALSVLQEGLQRHSDFRAGLVVLGRVLLDLARPEDAVSALERVLEEDPENCSALGMLVEEASLRRDWDSARCHLEALVVLQPDHEVWAGKLQDIKEKARQSEEASKPAPSQTIGSVSVAHAGGDLATLTLVDIYLAQGYREKALSALRKIAAEAPDRDDVRHRLEELQGSEPGAENLVSTARNSEGGTGPDPGRLAQVQRRSRERRAADKAQFQAWLATLNQGRGRTP